MKVKCPRCGYEFEVEESEEVKKKIRKAFFAGFYG